MAPPLHPPRRSKRIREHFAHHKALKAWRADVHLRLQRWRGELRAGAAVAAASREHALAGEGERSREAAEQLAARQQVVGLEEELRRAQLDHDVVGKGGESGGDLGG